MLVNSTYFREAAIHFTKYGCYTKAPKGSKDWYEYWREEEKRCLQGYKVGDTKITGKHYFYLNYTPIKRVVGKGKTQRKVVSFPAFWEIDYNWWWYKEIAWYGCTPEQLSSLKLWKEPTYLGGARHLSCLKTRRAGFSYKEAADGTYNYNFIPGSISYFLADKEDYLIKDGILNKVGDNLDWLNKYTDGYWLKNRHKHNTLMHQEASYIDNKDKQVKGFKSSIIGVTVAGDPDKARGKDGLKITFEEAGSFNNLKAALDIVVPSVRSGSTLTGQISVFGTGGEEGADIEGLDEIFNDPETYDMLPFKNAWEDYEATECGVFIPCYMANTTFIDEETGKVDIQAAIEADDVEREKKRKATDPKALDRRMAEFPRTPTEALIRVSVNNFPAAEAKYQKARIKNSLEFQGLLKHGELVRELEGLRFYVKSRVDACPVDYYPHKKDHNIQGCITIVQEPQRDSNGKISENLYIVNVDPYYDDEAEDTTSLGSVYVTKRFNNFTPTHSMDVAWFNGRPRSLTTFHENVVKLAEYYNAKIQSEVGGGGKGLYDYCYKHKKLHLLEFTPININNQEIKKEKGNRTYLMTMSTDDKRQGITYYQDYLKEIVGIDENGNQLLNIHFVYDLGLLDEIIKFNPKKNADRISAQIVKQFMLREKYQVALKDSSKKNTSLADRGLFGKTTGQPLLRLKGDDVFI